MRARDVNRRIERLGGVVKRQTGSHRRYEVTYEDLTTGTVKVAYTIVAQHPGDIPVGTLRAIERDLEGVFGKGWLR